jgi:hypothetical protein
LQNRKALEIQSPTAEGIQLTQNNHNDRPVFVALSQIKTVSYHNPVGKRSL